MRRCVTFLVLGLSLAFAAGLAAPSSAAAHGISAHAERTAPAGPEANLDPAPEHGDPAPGQSQPSACHHGSVTCGSASAALFAAISLPEIPASGVTVAAAEPYFRPTTPEIRLPPPRS